MQDLGFGAEGLREPQGLGYGAVMPSVFGSIFCNPSSFVSIGFRLGTAPPSVIVG